VPATKSVRSSVALRIRRARAAVGPRVSRGALLAGRPVVSASVLILNGAEASEPVLNRLADRVEAELGAQGVRVVRHDLAGETVAFCQGCFECWVKTPGLCKADDAAQGIASDLVHSDAVLMLSRIAFGCYAPTLKKAMDRLIPLVSPFFAMVEGETHHQKRYARYPALFGVGLLMQPDPEQGQIFTELVARNARNMYSPLQRAEVLEPGAEDAPGLASRLLDMAELVRTCS